MELCTKAFLMLRKPWRLLWVPVTGALFREAGVRGRPRYVSLQPYLCSSRPNQFRQRSPWERTCQVTVLGLDFLLATPLLLGWHDQWVQIMPPRSTLFRAGRLHVSSSTDNLKTNQFGKTMKRGPICTWESMSLSLMKKVELVHYYILGVSREGEELSFSYFREWYSVCSYRQRSY